MPEKPKTEWIAESKHAINTHRISPSRLGASPGSLAPEVQTGQSLHAGQGELGEVGLVDGLPAGWAWTDLGEVTVKKVE